MSASGGSSAFDAVTRVVLPSGLRLLCAPLPATHRTSVSVHIQSGSRFEPPELGGISHFHEHMLHRGTRSHGSAHALALAFERLGSELGAATYVDHTLLSANAPPENLNQVLALLGEVVSAPVWSGIEIERGIVREEILESLNEDGDPVSPDELVIALTFPDHALGRPITGTLAALDRFDVPALQRFHDQHYSASNMVVSVSGPIDPDEVGATVARAFEGLGAGAPLTSATPAPLSGPVFRYLDDAGSQTALRMTFRAPSEQDALEPAVELLLRTLDDGMSTRLYHQVCDERGLAYDVSASYEAFADTGAFTLGGESAHGSSEKLLTAFFEVVDDLRREGPSELEVEKAKQRFGWQMQSLLDDPGEFAAFLGLGELTGVARTPEQRKRELFAVSRDRVHAAAQAVFQKEALAVAVVGQLREKQRSALSRLVERFA
ncbi:MAG TPA: pitrilysin family protein [Polyangiaceae bacterium]|nr:pitrilysin family protein [Polyangiaceae bacterium]